MQLITNKRFAQKNDMKNREKEQLKKGIRIRQVDDYLKFALFLVVIGMFYIWNSHYAVKQVREMEELKKEAKNLKSRYLIKQSTLNAQMRLSEVSELVDSLGLKQSEEPIFKLVRQVQESVDQKSERLRRLRESPKDTLMDTLIISEN